MPSWSDLNFVQPFWLWGLLLPLLLWFQPSVRMRGDRRYKRYADPELLAHLLLKQERLSARWRRTFLLWSLLWSLGCIAMAGPRWDFTEVELFQPGVDVVVLLDLSRSMDVPDVKPSRLERAHQEIEDLLDLDPEVRVGLIGFASVAHIIAPITDDLDTIRYVLPAVSTDLVELSGSRLSAALDRARRLLSGQPPGGEHTLLLISDGDFPEHGLDVEVGKLYAQGIRVNVLGVGTPEGGPVPDAEGSEAGWMTDSRGRRIISRLNQPVLESIARWGGGIYRQADFRDTDTRALLEAIRGEQSTRGAKPRGTMRIWNERYFWLIGAMLILILPWFRRARRSPMLGS
jgi:Ca-activated chloride channel family protein